MMRFGILIYDLRNASWDEWKTHTKEVFMGFISEFDCDKDSEDVCKSLTQCILACADEVIPKKRICKHSKSFMNEDLKLLLQNAKKARNQYRQKGDPTNHRRYKESVDTFTSEYIKARETNFRNMCSNLDITDPSIWKKITKLRGGEVAPIVQPLRDPITNQVAFEDSEISRILTDTHIRKNVSNNPKFDEEWYKEVNSQTETWIREQSLGLQNDPHEDYNADLYLSETRAALQRMKIHAAPGPDGILPIMLKNGDTNLHTALHMTYQSCWKQGVFPTTWKKENRIYIAKPDKESYNVPKSYRGISLAPISGKGYERVGETRFRAWIHASGLLDPLQFAYKKDHSVTTAMMHYTLSVWKGFMNNEFTVTGFIDLEGAFDMVWREALMYKLYKAGLRGRLFMFIVSYLKDRVVRNLVNTHTSEWLETYIGVPQGSVIAPILFTFFINDMTAMLYMHISYADDLILWVTKIDLNEACKLLEIDLETIKKWCGKWRMSVNVPKTDVMCHAYRSKRKIAIKMDGQELRQTDSKRCLGVVVDEQLNFTKHVDHVCGIALSALNKVTPIYNATTVEASLHLYRTLVRPHLERTFPIWCSASQTAKNKVDRVQRQALLRASGAFVSTPTTVLEVITHTPPIRLRLDDVLLLEFARINKLSADHPLRNLITELSRGCNTVTRGLCTPIHMFKALTRKLPAHIDLTNVELASHPTMEKLKCDTPTIYNMDKAFGSSNNRTHLQTRQAHAHIEEQLSSIPAGEPILFTDGSALGNPGACGAAVICYPEGLQSLPLTIKEPVSNYSTNYHGELRAIKVAAQYLKISQNPPHTRNAHIFSDCKAAIQAVSTTVPHVTLQDEIDSAQINIGILQNESVPPVKIHLYWIPGHAQFGPNELADQAAKNAANDALIQDVGTPSSMSSLKSSLKTVTHKKWQKSWERGSECYHNLKSIPKTRYISTHNRKLESKYIRLLTGHSRLNDHLSKLFPIDTPCCDCSRERQTPQHIVMACPLYDNPRRTLFDNIDLTYAKHHTPIWERNISFWDIFIPSHSDPSTRKEIRNHLFKFIDSLKVSI